jgi:hypothetical protein
MLLPVPTPRRHHGCCDVARVMQLRSTPRSPNRRTSSQRCSAAHNRLICAPRPTGFSGFSRIQIRQVRFVGARERQSRSVTIAGSNRRARSAYVRVHKGSMALFGQSRLMGYLWACGDPDAGWGPGGRLPPRSGHHACRDRDRTPAHVGVTRQGCPAFCRQGGILGPFRDIPAGSPLPRLLPLCSVLCAR